MADQPPELTGPEYVRLDRLLTHDPERAWIGIVRFVLTADRPLEKIALLEDLVDLHSEQFHDRLIAAAEADSRFAVSLGGIHLGDLDGPGVDLLGEWQDQYRIRRLSTP